MVNNEKPLLIVKEVSKHFGGIVAVDKVSIEVYPGEVLAIVGDNGAGKYTLIKMISGVYNPDSGTIFFNSNEITNLSPKIVREIGIETIYKDLALADNLDASSNIFLGREPVKNRLFNSKDTRRMIEESRKTLEGLGFTLPNIKRRVSDLSGGQRQGVAIARAVHWDAKLLIMDEPTASLDLAEVEKVYTLIRDLKKRDIAVIIISHNLQDIFEVGDRVVTLRLSKMVGNNIISETNMQEIVSLITGE